MSIQYQRARVTSFGQQSGGEGMNPSPTYRTVGARLAPSRVEERNLSVGAGFIPALDEAEKSSGGKACR